MVILSLIINRNCKIVIEQTPTYQTYKYDLETSQGKEEDDTYFTSQNPRTRDDHENAKL